jgi:hypothetical protein
MDIVERLRDWCEDPHDVSMGELAEYSHEAANEIERLRTNQSTIITSFRINMMRLRPEYSHEEFDKDIAAMLKEKE